MSAPKQNQFWKLRSKHGRNKLFESPELLYTAACEYFEWCNKNPWVKTETTKKGEITDIKTMPTERPMTLTGLCIYLDCSSSYFRVFKKTIKDKNKNITEKDKDFLTIITRIEEIIYTNKFEGAAVGAYNANIIARDLGLKDKTDITSNDKEIVFNFGGIELKTEDFETE